MRFIVMVDLLSTVIAPVTVAYIVYLIVIVATHQGSIPLTSIILLCAIYGLQAVIFLLHRKFEMIGWMAVYIVGIPIWSLFLPLYSFWHMDDFSWGNTRVVTGEAGKKVVIHDEGSFDPAEIPLKTWAEYENELWDRGSNQSVGTLLDDQKQDKAAVESAYGSAPSNWVPSFAGSKASSKAGSMFAGASVQPHGTQWSGTAPPSIYGADPEVAGAAGSLAMPMHSVQGTAPPIYGQVHPAGYASGLPSPMLYGPGSVHYRPRGSGRGSVYSSSMMGGYSGFETPGTWAAPASMRDQTYGAPNAPPTDAVLEADIRALIAASDLSVLTKKQIRLQLERKYATSLAARKGWLNQTIERLLAESM